MRQRTNVTSMSNYRHCRLVVPQSRQVRLSLTSAEELASAGLNEASWHLGSSKTVDDWQWSGQVSKRACESVASAAMT